ncbi:MAG: hypothetical protein ACOCWO_04150, partial [Candidatus Muiribacteriaceae bacterium]
ENLVEANRYFKKMVDELVKDPENFINSEDNWKLLLRLRDRLKDSNTTNAHVGRFNRFCLDNCDMLAGLPSFKERPCFYWWNHLDLINNGEMAVNIERAEVNFEGVGYSIE